MHGVLHRDAATRNMLYDASTGNVMFVDFSLSQVCTREPLQVLSSNLPGRKCKLGEVEGVKKFVEECELAMDSIKNR